MIHDLARRYRGRPGSILEDSDRKRVWLACFVLIALVTLTWTLMSPIVTPLELLLLA